MKYLPGITFLFLASAVISIPFVIFVKNRWLAIFLSVCLSALILKTWAYFAVGGFDPGFLMVQITTGLCAAIAVRSAVETIRGRTRVS